MESFACNLDSVVSGEWGKRLLPGLLNAAIKQGQTDAALNLADRVEFTAQDWFRYCTKAAKVGNDRLVLNFIARGADIEWLDSKERSLFHFVAMSGSIPLTNYLISKRACQLHPDKCWKTPLWYAASGGHQELVGHLLALRNATDRFDPRPRGGFYNALSDKIRWSEITFNINGCGGHIGYYTPVWAAIEGGNEEVFEALVRQGFRYDEPEDDGVTPLQLAVRLNRLFMVKTLLSTKTPADPNTHSHHGRTPLDEAVSNDSLEMVNLLLAACADVNGVRGEHSPLHTAYASGASDAIIQALMAAGADPNMRNRWDRLPIELIPGEPVVKKLKAGFAWSNEGEARKSDVSSPQGSTPAVSSGSPYAPAETPSKRSSRGSPHKGSSPLTDRGFQFHSPCASVTPPTQKVSRQLFPTDENVHPNPIPQ